MRLLAIFSAFLLVGSALCAPVKNETTEEDETLVITKDFYDNQFVIYTGEHDIVSILLPLNHLNFEEDSDDDNTEEPEIKNTLFFVEADTKANGEKDYKGLYVLKDKVASKILENGRDAAAANDDTKKAYFAATDGLYVYNAATSKADKYGSLTDNIIGIAKYNGTDLIYILTEDKSVYKVTEEGTKKEKIESIKDAQQIVLDYNNNLYFLNSEKKVSVYSESGVKTVEGLPETITNIKLWKAPFILEDGIPVLVDSIAYVAYANGTSEKTDFVFEAKPSATAVEGTIIQYYGYEKKIYEYNILAILFGELVSELKTFLDSKSDAIESIATRSRGELVGN